MDYVGQKMVSTKISGRTAGFTYRGANGMMMDVPGDEVESEIEIEIKDSICNSDGPSFAFGKMAGKYDSVFGNGVPRFPIAYLYFAWVSVSGGMEYDFDVGVGRVTDESKGCCKTKVVPIDVVWTEVSRLHIDPIVPGQLLPSGVPGISKLVPIPANFEVEGKVTTIARRTLRLAVMCCGKAKVPSAFFL